MDYKFQRKRLNEMSETTILDELEKAAKHFNYIEFGRRDFDKIAISCSWKKQEPLIYITEQHV